ncbi:MAG TPA: TetR/AcrR family transcriptional regulator [Flavisolibacter sp.]|nr:TetR/AcrR family transcriptional regulator [Flavisolibacter sp.]
MSQDQKRDAIVEAAIRRFAHFGVAKTTMSEIATDLALSKASLYYYFPDKLSLYAAVLQRIAEAGEKNDDEALAKEKDPLKAILFFLEKRTEFIIKYHNILEFLKTFTSNNIPKELEPVFSYLKKRELQRITAVIESGLRQGHFTTRDPRRSAELYYDFLEGFRFAFFTRNPNFFPDKKQFQAILKREKEFTVIFFNGLSCES